jgi:hypothetical protein
MDSQLQLAREKARQRLSGSQSFKAMSLTDQRNIYTDIVKDELDKINKRAKAQTVSRSFAGPGAGMGFGDYDPGFQNSIDNFEDLVDSVDFPKFVSDLLKAVFDANMDVMKKQTDAYIKLMKEATKSVAEFIKNVKPEAAFIKLASENREQYNITSESVTNPDGSKSQKMILANPEGEPVDMEDNEVKAKIMDATIALAKEERAALREVLLMGVTRLIVEKGEIEAGVEFSITAKRHSQKDNSNTNTNVFAASGSYGGFFGGGFSVSEQNTNINVSTSNKTADDELAAKLKGRVNIKFKTDYFKLDNFANMYGDGGIAALKQGAAGAPAGAAAAPAGPAIGR